MMALDYPQCPAWPILSNDAGRVFSCRAGPLFEKLSPARCLRAVCLLRAETRLSAGSLFLFL